MKIIEKKCPNCGAQLTFEPEDTEARCNYCGQEFIIEKDIKDETKKMSEELLAKHIKLQKKMVGGVFAAQKIFLIIFFIVFIGIFVFSFKTVYNQISGTPSVKMEQIDQNTIDMIHSSSVDTLKQWSGLPTLYAKSNYESMGFYLYKDTFYTKISDVYKITYTNKKSGQSIDIYTCVTYRDVNYKNDTVTLNYDGSVTSNIISLDESIFDTVHGYKTIEELYTKEILPSAEGKVYATEGLYR